MSVKVTGKDGSLKFDRGDDDVKGETLSTNQPKPDEETQKRSTPTPTQQAAGKR